MNSNDSFNDIKSRNIKIANWFRLLYEVVIFFGEDTTIKDPIKYHGISTKLLFDEFSPNFHSPISTTTDFDVAQRFGLGGIIVALHPNGSREDISFFVKWLSAHPEEEEYLFVEAVNLNIVNIRYICDKKLLNNSLYIRAMRLFDEIFKSYYFMFGSMKNILKTQNCLCKLITCTLKRSRDYMFKMLNENENLLACDYMFKMLNENENLLSYKKDIKLFCDFLLENEYDTDAIMIDLKNEKNENNSITHSNIFQYFCNKKQLQLVSEYVKTITDIISNGGTKKK
eukprot:460154_1